MPLAFAKCVCLTLLTLFFFGQQETGAPKGKGKGERQQQKAEAQPTVAPTPQSPHIQANIQQPETAPTQHDGQGKQAAPPNDANKPMTRAEQFTLLLAALTFAVIAFQTAIYAYQLSEMRKMKGISERQALIMEAQAAVMREQLDSIKEGSAQTQQMIDLTRQMANQNRQLVGHAGEQAGALTAQANAYTEMVSQNERLVRSAEIQADAAREQANVVLKQFQIHDRPWLSVDVAPNGPITFNDEGGVHLSVRFMVKNIGRSVAVGMTLNVTAFIPKWREDMNAHEEAIERQKEVCGKIDTSFMAYTLFPERHHVIDWSFGLGKQDVEDGRLAGGNHILIYLVGCVDYQFSGQTDHHQTGFIYDAHRFDPTMPYARFLIEVGKVVPPEGFVLDKSFLGGDYAN
jgi:hypothetical protein